MFLFLASNSMLIAKGLKSRASSKAKLQSKRFWLRYYGRKSTRHKRDHFPWPGQIPVYSELHQYMTKAIIAAIALRHKLRKNHDPWASPYCTHSSTDLHLGRMQAITCNHPRGCGMPRQGRRSASGILPPAPLCPLPDPRTSGPCRTVNNKQAKE